MSSTDQPSDPQSSEPQSFFDRLRSLLGTFRPHGSLRTDLAEVLDAGSAAEEVSEFSGPERKMLRNILHLRDVGLDDIMVPRAEIVAVQKETSLADVLKVFASAAHSRLVVYDDTLDEPVGMIHIRDLVTHMTTTAAAETGRIDLSAVDLEQSLDGSGLIRRLLYVPPSMPPADLLVAMQATHIHLALVIDEYGGTDGLVSIEDVVEQIVGEIEDEHDEAGQTQLQAQEDGSFIIDARAPLEEVLERLGPAFASEEALEEVDTIGGLAVLVAARVPQAGEIITLPGGYGMEVLDADPRRVKKLRIIPPCETEEAGGSVAAGSA